ncbi:copper chaperone for superoxide dismutase-like [Cottoperca gobio]|uniref:Superoxide dismutase copper chaperone n=1 Tax=Cottoperca gobio TaxID=56716 RepID=A0A6J2RJG5_COTGO|nr:copper chaperone for superoxide dismutase-like [Cottoperca gobio]XP_029310346.1 copper chaperone for superoxide dismutase-like [Cottoperca gobio]
MAAPVGSYSRFVSVSRKIGSLLFNSVCIAQAAACGTNMDSVGPTKLEFAVQMTCESCAVKVRAALEGEPGVKSVSVDVGKEEVLVDSTLTSAEVQALIESTGRRAVLKGMGGSERDLGSAVAMLAGVGKIQGVVRFLQLSEQRCLIDGTIDGLEPGPHGLHVHALGDLTLDCLSCGEHYNPLGQQHGGPGDSERHVGDLGNIVAAPDGRASFRQEDSQLKVWDVIGRSLVVDAGEDDLGRGAHPLSKQTGNSGERLACGIIARSAGLFQNPKQICACDGVTLWEERDRPIAGIGRSKANAEIPAAHL